MGERGPRSIEQMMVPNNMAQVLERPDAPYDLSDEEADEWRAQVGAMPADHFMRGNYPVLASYCRAIVAERDIGRMLADYKSPSNKTFNFREYAALLEQLRAQSLSITRLARSMRLTQQAVSRASTTYHPQGQTIEAPWSRDK